MLTPIDSHNAAAALDLLARGFPARSPHYWANALHNIREFGGNREAGVPVGFLLDDAGRFGGVVLTPASIRNRPDGSVEKVVNLASWYVEPEQRWRAPVMLRAILRQPGCVFTDLTPTTAVQKMLIAFGFRQLTAGVTVTLLAAAALRGGEGEIVDLAAAPAEAVDAATRRLLESHLQFDCVAAALRHQRRWYPLLFKCRHIMKIPAAVLLYAECNATVYRNLAVVARYLLSKGRLLLVLDMPLTATAPGFERPAKTPRFAKDGDFENRTDHAGSELALFEW